MNLRVRVLSLALPMTAAISAALVVPGWVPTLPRPVRRAITEVLLQTVLGLSAAVAVIAVVGALVLGWLLGASLRGHPLRPRIARYFLGCLSCLIAVCVLEVGSAAWRAWMHRLPALPVQFAATPAEEYRIVVLGGSSACGEPYWPWLSVGQIVSWRLSQAVAGRRFACEVLAYPGDSLEMQHHKLAGLTRRPDAVIIYSGHNEFAARFEEEREGWQDGPTGAWLSRFAHRAGVSSSFCALAYETISKNRLDRPPSMALRHQLIDPPVCSPVESAAILGDFRRRLEAIVAYCDQIGALPILIVPPANESGYEPGRSTIASSVPAHERQKLVQEFNDARAREADDPGASEAQYAAILARHAGFAEAHFRLARLLERQGRLTEAAPHYLAALDNDGLPLRCQAPFRVAYYEVANRHPRGILIDGRRELSAISTNGLLGDDVIHDTHHPTLRGYLALASAVLRGFERSGVFGDGRALGARFDPAACAVHFGMNADRWADLCDRVSAHYSRVAGYRYDPAERLAKARRYAEAAQRIRSGRPTDDLGLAGIPPMIPAPGQEPAPTGNGPAPWRSNARATVGPGRELDEGVNYSTTCSTCQS
jgi:hypothetical protein